MITLGFTIFVFILSVLLCFIYLLQLVTEAPDVAKVPFFIHRAGPFTSLGLLGYALGYFSSDPLTYAAVFIVNLNQSGFLFVLCIIALYAVDTMKTINQLKLQRGVFLGLFISGLMNVVLSIIGVSLRLGLNEFWPQLIPACYTFTSVNVSWIFMAVSYYHIIKTMNLINPHYRSHMYSTQMKTLKISIGLISLICIAATIFNFISILSFAGDIHSPGARDFNRDTFLSGFIIQMCADVVMLWYGWSPIKVQLPKSSKSKSRTKGTQNEETHLSVEIGKVASQKEKENNTSNNNTDAITDSPQLSNRSSWLSESAQGHSHPESRSASGSGSESGSGGALIGGGGDGSPPVVNYANVGGTPSPSLHATSPTLI